MEVDYVELKHAQHQQFVFEIKTQLKTVISLIVVVMCEYSNEKMLCKLQNCCKSQYSYAQSRQSE